MPNRNAIPTLAAATLLASGAIASAADVLTLDQAVTLALANNRAIESSSVDIDKAKDKLAANRTKQFPSFSLYMLGAQQLRSFDFTLEKGVLGDYASTGPLPSEDVHLKTPLAPTGLITARVAQPLTTLFRIRRNLDTLKTGVKLAEEQTRAERQKISRDVKRVYYNLQQADSSLRTVRETLALYQEIEKLTSNYVIQEVALRGDLLEAQTRLAKANQAELSLNNQKATAKEQLNQLLGRDVLMEFEVEPVLDISGDEPDLVMAREQALRDRTEIRQALLKQQQAQQDLRAKKAERIPDIATELNNLSFLNWGRFMPTQSTSVGLSLSWEPFDWGRKKHETSEKAHTVEQATIAEKEARSTVIVDVNDKYRQLAYRRSELRAARLAQDTAVERLRVAKNKYAVQAALVKDVLYSEVSLEESNSDYNQALTSFWNARADFERAIGENQ
jgi:outer membrane protein